MNLKVYSVGSPRWRWGASFVIVLLSLAFIGGCEGDEPEAATTASPPMTIREAMRSRLYAKSTAQLSIWPAASAMPTTLRVRGEKAGHILAAVAPEAWDIWSISYQYTSLPQVSILMRSSRNRKLLVYNHGHSGLPGPSENFALEFLRDAHSLGHDILVTSMPLTGLNAAIASETYSARTRTGASSVTISPPLLQDFYSQHALYELIGDPDHYLHYFIDGGVMPAFVLQSGGVSSNDSIPYFPSQTFPSGLKQYDMIDYVGFSGGGATGLVSCAVHRFDHCILYAGLIPDHLRLGSSANFGDAEQWTRSFYEEFSFDVVLQQASVSSRKLILIFNSEDPCCFANPSATIFKNEYPAYDVRIENLNFHGYQAAALVGALRE